MSAPGGFAQLAFSVPARCLEVRENANGPMRENTDKRSNDAIEFWVIANEAGLSNYVKVDKICQLKDALDASSAHIPPKAVTTTSAAAPNNQRESPFQSHITS